MNGSSTRLLRVEAGGTQVVAYAGLHALGRFADRVGLGAALSPVIPWTGERAPDHDRGTVLTQAMLMLAGGGECVADIEHLRVQDVLFGDVCSDSTLYRTVRTITPTVLADLIAAVGTVREQVWARMPETRTGPVVLDADASLVEVHSENKQGTAPTYKGGFGFGPMLCFDDTTGDVMAAVLRPGNAAANSIADHLTVLDAAIGQLPAVDQAGHHPGDPADEVVRAVQIRTDSAGCTHGFVDGCRARNVGFAVVARTNTQIHTAISRIDPTGTRTGRWTKAIRASGDIAKRSEVAEITDLVDLSDWPTGTRLIVRREPLHPGAQRSLFPSDNYRYWGHYTDTATGTPAELDLHMRAHAHVEDHIKRLKASGLERFPFSDLDANRAWLQLVCTSADLVGWFQRLCIITGPLAKAAPKRLRWQLWHTPARVVRRARQQILRIIDHWPTTNVLLDAYTRINALI